MHEVSEGRPEPPGLSADAAGANVAVVAPQASAVFLCLFDAATGDREVARLRLPARTGDVWHGHVAGLAPGARYGLRAEGPWDPARGLRFDPAKLLLDPWATALDRPFRQHPALLRRGADTAAHVPKAILPAPLPPPPLPPPPAQGTPRLIYEMHVRGFTRLHPGIPHAIRGTCAALAHPAAIAHLRRLGVTHVELMPLAAGIDERHLPPLGLTNHWNYNPVALLAPDPRIAPGGMAEVRAAIAALRAAGIGTILDVVLNHTGEGDAEGPTLSLRGLAEGLFHRLGPDDGLHANESGCGNTLALDRPWPLRLAMDALRHWVLQAGVEGFRLDLAAVLGRRGGAGGFDPDAPLIAAMRQDPVLRDRIVIAEPWDIGPGGYQLGRFPPGWGEWNDRFRDDVRRFWRGDAGMLGALATRLAGSADLFGAASHRRVTDSINYVAAHDGFTLADLVSHEERRNHANGEDGRDGHHHNFSWNCGAEGPSDDPAVRARRAGDVRALLATLFAARGTPMLGMGDEAGRSQDGNNNAYAQDNATTWLDWARMDHGLADFTARLAAIRRTHPALTADRPLTGAPVDASGIPDVAWLRADGGALGIADWEDPAAATLLAVLHAAGDRVAVALHRGAGPVPLRLPAPRPGHRWRLLIDSADPEEARGTAEALAPRSVQIHAEEVVPRGTAPDPALLEALAGAAGIATDWHDLAGGAHRVPEPTLQALLGALGLPAGSMAQARDSLARLRAPEALPPALTVRAGSAAALALGPPLAGAQHALALHLRLEDGTETRLVVSPAEGAWDKDGVHRRVALPPLPAGRHLLRAEDLPGLACHLAAVPESCFLPPALASGARRFGIAAQTYALRHPAGRDQGIGDFGALAALAREAAAAGAMLLGLSPPHALPPVDRERASPYQPSDRRFLEPVLIDVSALPHLADAPAVREALAAEAPVFAALAARENVDYPAAWAAKRRVLEAAWRSLGPGHPARPAFEAFRAAGGEALARFAAHVAIAEHQGHADARRWPADLRRGDAPGVAAWAAGEAAAFAAFQQWIADAQLAEAARQGVGLYRDLAIGAAPDGAEIWSGDGAFLPGFSIGAPPDAFAPEGQVWGLPPPDPHRGRRQGHAAFAALLRANMRHAAALRIDHVMGLRRLFLVPEGARGAEGAYLHYPFRELVGQVALESHRARCLVIGEDLGTVPPGMRAALDDARVLAYRVLWFEREADGGFRPPEAWPPLAAACVATHDLPTLAGWLAEEDLEERERLGLLDPAARARAAAQRAADRAALAALLGAEPTPEALHALVARTPSLLMLVQAEDLAGARIAVNLPGTDRERPNWRRRLPDASPLGTEQARAILAALGGRCAGG